ncbi:unnamed protein product [Caenorhabditis brenneri]
MSLSRPIKFPILKLPWLCIESVVRSWNIFDIIFFAGISQKTRRIVKILKIPLNGIEVYLTYCKTNIALMTYTHQNLRNFLKMAMEFLNEVFNCSVETVEINGDSFPESGEVGVKSTVNLSVDLPFKYAQGQKLSLLLENLEVTGTCTLRMAIIEKDFYVEPKLFKCRELVFLSGSGAWITREILLQFEIPQLTFFVSPFSGEDIAAFVTNWFHSDNKKLEYLYIGHQNEHTSLKQLRRLNPFPFSQRNRIPPSESFTRIDFSKGLEIVRQDGLQATIHVTERDFLFYIWRNQ